MISRLLEVCEKNNPRAPIKNNSENYEWFLQENNGHFIIYIYRNKLAHAAKYGYTIFLVRRRHVSMLLIRRILHMNHILKFDFSEQQTFNYHLFRYYLDIFRFSRFLLCFYYILFIVFILLLVINKHNAFLLKSHRHTVLSLLLKLKVFAFMHALSELYYKRSCAHIYSIYDTCIF